MTVRSCDVSQVDLAKGCHLQQIRFPIVVVLSDDNAQVTQESRSIDQDVVKSEVEAHTLQVAVPLQVGSQLLQLIESELVVDDEGID